MSNILNFWTDEKVEQAIFLVKHLRLSASQAARELGCTRNAVIGKLARLGQSIKKEKPVSYHPRKRSRPRPRQRLTAGVRPPVDMSLPIEPVIATPVRFVDTREDQCRWPLTEPDHNMLCCGAKRSHKETMYCEHHYAMSLNANQPRSRDERLPKEADEA